MRAPLLPCLLSLLAAALIAGQAPATPPVKPKAIPGPGIAIEPAVRQELSTACDALAKRIADLRSALAGKPALAARLPDVEVFHRAVRSALDHDEFLAAKEVDSARKLLALGSERAERLAAGSAPWLTQSGLVVRGYRSRIDGSAQPYGLVVPDALAKGDQPARVDAWFHGRDEKLTEVNFLSQRLTGKGEFTPANAIVLHAYGRFCNANKFAGEVDLLEALADLRSTRPLDDDRLVVRGFSMGGAACWQFAVHHAGTWCAAAPGAGFAETPAFSHVDPTTVPPWERLLWRWYDARDWAVNLANLTLVAYSGEIDRQRQAAEVMAVALKEEGIAMTHVIGPKTEHKYHPESKTQINTLIDAAVAKGRDPLPKKLRFTTWTLRYDRLRWLRVDGLAKHWERARVEAELTAAGVTATTVNVTALTIDLPAGAFAVGSKPVLSIDGGRLDGPAAAAGAWQVHLVRTAQGWALAEAPPSGVRKRHGLQGPIDDAFMDRFVFVRPTGKARNAEVGAWIDREFTQACALWRRTMRGEPLIVDDTAVDDALIAAANLVLWGDPASNAVLARIADRLPITWDAQNVQIAGSTVAAASHVPLLIHPNPLNPARYIVLNSGLTWAAEYHSASNARMNPVLPDWAIVAAVPGRRRVIAAGFCDEAWKPQPAMEWTPPATP